jgi:hypothetical protein
VLIAPERRRHCNGKQVQLSALAAAREAPETGFRIQSYALKQSDLMWDTGVQ